MSIRIKESNESEKRLVIDSNSIKQFFMIGISDRYDDDKFVQVKFSAGEAEEILWHLQNKKLKKFNHTFKNIVTKGGIGYSDKKNSYLYYIDKGGDVTHVTFSVGDMLFVCRYINLMLDRMCSATRSAKAKEEDKKITKKETVSVDDQFADFEDDSNKLPDDKILEAAFTDSQVEGLSDMMSDNEYDNEKSEKLLGTEKEDENPE